MRIHLYANPFQEVHQSNPFDHFATAFVLQAVLRPEIDRVLCDLGDGLVVLFRLEFHEGHDHSTHQVTNLQRPFAAHQDRYALVVSRGERLGHHVQAMHAAHAVTVVDLDRVVVLQTHAARRTARDDVIDSVLATLFCNVILPGLLIHFHVIAPGSNHRHISALD